MLGECASEASAGRLAPTPEADALASAADFTLHSLASVSRYPKYKTESQDTHGAQWSAFLDAQAAVCGKPMHLYAEYYSKQLLPVTL